MFIYAFTPPQDGTQGQSLNEVKLVWIQSFHNCLTIAKELSLLWYLPKEENERDPCLFYEHLREI